jgi:hypothetical protein
MAWKWNGIGGERRAMIPISGLKSETLESQYRDCQELTVMWLLSQYSSQRCNTTLISWLLLSLPLNIFHEKRHRQLLSNIASILDAQLPSARS